MLSGIPIDPKKKHYVIPATINGTPCLLSTGRSFPFHTYEIIASIPLRQTLGLQDGMVVTISVNSEHLVPVKGWKEKVWELLYLGRESAYYKEDVFSKLRKNFLFRRIHKFVVHGYIKEAR
jgi:hypothetical protein